MLSVVSRMVPQWRVASPVAPKSLPIRPNVQPMYTDSFQIRFGRFNAYKTAEASLPAHSQLLNPEQVRVFTGKANAPLANKVAKYLGLQVSPTDISKFKNGATYVEIKDKSVRGKDTFIVQPVIAPVNDRFMELLAMVDALRRAHAKSINVVMPHNGYDRGDKREKGKQESIMAKLTAELLTRAGVNNVVLMDPHFAQIEGFFGVPVDTLTAIPLVAGYIRKKNLQDVVIVSPDNGGVKRAELFAKALGVPYAGNTHKYRPAHNQSEIRAFYGMDIRGKVVILYDDMIDTAGTMAGAAAYLKSLGAKQVIAVGPHGVLSGPAIKNLQNSEIDEVIVTDTIPLKTNARKLDKITQITIAPIIGEAIARMMNGEDVSEISQLVAR